MSRREEKITIDTIELKKELQTLRKKEQTLIKRVPPVPSQEHLWAAQKGNHFEYYKCIQENGIWEKEYLPKKERKTARKLAQEEYDRKLLKTMQKQIKTLEHFLKNYDPDAIPDLYGNLSAAKRDLVHPIVPTPQDYAASWQETTYERKEIHLQEEHYTEKGERVRSKSEKIIADKLYLENIPYHYERPLFVEGLGMIHPNFCILNVRTGKEWLWEHCGMMDSERYYNDFVKRQNAYFEEGYIPGENLILTFESRSQPISKKTIEMYIDLYLK